MRDVTGRWRRSGRGGRRAGGHGPARRAACLLMALQALLVCLTGCSGLTGGTDGRDRALQGVLDRWAAAVRDHDENAYLAAVDPAAEAYRAEQRRVFANLAAVPFASWDYRLVRTGGFTPERGDGGGRRVAAEAELRYRLAGYDGVPVTTRTRLTLVERGGRWYVAAEAAPQGGGQLWQQGPVTVVRGERSLVLGVGQDRERLRALAALADKAVPAVGAAWHAKPREWPGRVVVEMPASLERMAALLDSPVSNYRGIAAVTTGEAGGTGAAAPADRIIVNPEAYGVLGEFGRRIVLTHETAHVATRAKTTKATPLWLSEGFADWAAYRGTGRTARQAAPELARAAAAGRLPRELPGDPDFGFAGEAGKLARAYEEGWLACRLIAEHWSEEKLVAFYRAVGDHGRRDGAVEDTLRSVLGISPGEFTARWRTYVAEQFGSD
ncbi:hypothetical protein IPZ58_21945 [Streptomyces roseoverticillatus]|uniref:hypothetical protein n=1 Tax=Streptomyces roseoverticillatus TaxID=66429 RepID=UPI001F22A2DA|nr:hypothetical protein [Streptomyces roseoverticillatus]MCF3104233.1 hypothetical protein [Streptomyces roseoverticillatus]